MSQALPELTAAVSAFAAAAALAEGGVPRELEGPVRDVVAAAGLDPRDLPLADLRNTLLQAADLAARSREGTLAAAWTHGDPLVLQAQGDVSAQPVGALVDQVLPRLGIELRDFLDVGAGVGAMCIAVCRRLPQARAVGIEPQEAPLALARRDVAEAALEPRRRRAAGGRRPSSRAAPWGNEMSLGELEELGRDPGFADVMRGPAQGAMSRRSSCGDDDGRGPFRTRR